MKYTHDTDISSDIVLSLEDELDEGKDTTHASKNYKWLCQRVPQDVLDNFLGWFGQECIERYTVKKKETIDEDNLDELAEQWCPESGSYREGDIETQRVIRNAYKAGYCKAKEQ